MIVDLFAGPGGWSEALRRHWPHHHAHEVGFEWDRDACATRAAADHVTIRADVAAWPLGPLEGRVEGLIASPPCQTFSAAGKGGGRQDLERLVAHAHRGALYETPDPRTGLVLEPLRWIHHLKPRWIALEQVPGVAPVWHAYEHHLNGLGYATWSGILNAANYGVPQTRKRALLLASLDRQPAMPAATHQDRPDGLFSLAPWVSMAAALRWDEDFEVGFPRRDDRGDSPDGYRTRDWRSTDEPAFALTEKARSWVRRERSGARSEEGFDAAEGPAQTITSKARSWSVLDRGTNSRGPGGTVQRSPLVDSDRPGPTLTQQARSWRTDPREPTSRLLTVDEALVLQTFPAEYPVAGSRSSSFLQIANAIPTRLAAAALSEVLP